MAEPRELVRAAWDATYGRLFSALYDRGLAATERAGLAERRADLLAQASGVTVELGAGTGLNLPHYPGAVEELVLTEPFEPMADQLRERLAAAAPATPGRVVEAPAERLPLADGEADTVVSTLVLCTVDDLAASLAEIARVLRPGGRLLFLEHVRAADPGLARWQDRLHGPWLAFGHGCHCNRDTEAALGASSLEVEHLEQGEVPKAPPIVRPMIVGSAIRPG